MMRLTTMLLLGAQMGQVEALWLQRKDQVVQISTPGNAALCKCAPQLVQVLSATQLRRGGGRQPAAPAAAPAVAPAASPAASPTAAAAPSAPPVAVAAAEAAPPPPEPEPCECMKDAGKGMPTEPVSAEKALKAIEEAGEKAAKDGIEEMKAVAEKTAAAEIAKIKDSGKEFTGEEAKKELEKVEAQVLSDVEMKLDAEQKTQETIMEEVKENAKTAAMKNAGEVTKVAEDLATVKVQNVVGHMMSAAMVQAQGSADKAEQTKAVALTIVQVAQAAADKAEEAAEEAKAAAEKMPKKEVAKTTKFAEDSLKQAKSLEDHAQQAKAQAEQAAKVASDAKEISLRAFTTAKEAETTAEAAFAQATENAETIAGLKEKANGAIEAAKGASDNAKGAETTAVAVTQKAQQAAAIA